MVTSSARDEEDDAAVRWAIRLDGEPLGDEERAALDAWLEADERRRGSLLRAEAALAYLDRGRALAEPPFERSGGYRPTTMGRRAFIVGGSLGGLTAAGFLGIRADPYSADRDSDRDRRGPARAAFRRIGRVGQHQQPSRGGDDRPAPRREA